MPVIKTPDKPGILVAPAWGKVTSVTPVDSGYSKVSIFLSVFDVHFQCAPCEGVVEDTNYRKGRFVNALNADSSEVNEQNTIRIKTKDSGIISVTQIAGLIARRISCFVSAGEAVRPGNLIGLIKFGSRVDLTVPSGFKITVIPGQKVCGGESIIAEKT